jgi:uncharacterized repeat protein (TIGR03803 family)
VWRSFRGHPINSGSRHRKLERRKVSVAPASDKTGKALWEFRSSFIFVVGGGQGFDPSGIIRDAAGNLYGTTSDGGSANLGIVFEVTP